MKLKKPKKLKYQDGGAARDNTRVSPVPIGSLKAWNKYPRTPSPKEAGNTFLNEVINPFLNFGLASGTPGGGVQIGPQVLEGQKAVDYLNSQRAWRPGNAIGTKADMLQGNKYKYDAFETPWGDKMKLSTGVREEMNKMNWNSTINQGSTEVPATKRATQMKLNKQYGVNSNIKKGVDSGTMSRIDDHIPPISEVAGPKNSAFPMRANSYWDWKNFPSGDLPREEFPLDYVGSNQMGGPIVHPMGQLKYPGQVTQIPSNSISMAGVNYPVLGISDTGHSKMMQPGASYKFPGTSVTEYPMAGKMAVNKGMSQMGGGMGDHLIVPPMMMRKGGGKWTGPRPWNVRVDKNDSGGLKYGGSSDDCFPDEMSFPEQKKSDFLKFLRDTSMDQVKQDLRNDIQSYHNEFKKGGGFKINPKHKGWCTPMTKSTCTGKRRQFAINAKNHFKKQQMGGQGNYQPWYDYVPNAPGALPDLLNVGMEAATSFINNLPGGAQDRQKKWLRKTTNADWWNPLQQGSRGDYTNNYGYFRPDQYTPVQFPGAQGSYQYQDGGEYDLSQDQLDRLSDQYDIEFL